MKHSHKSPSTHKRRVPLSGRNSTTKTTEETPLEVFARKLNQVSKLESPSTGPKLFKEGPGGTLEQVGREADNAWAGVKKIMSLLNVESKAFDTQTTFTNGYAGNFLNCSNITQGVGDNQRTGDSLRITRIRAKFRISFATASTVVICVLGRSKDGAPVIGDIFDTIGTAYSGVSFENHDQRKADHILAWKQVVVDNVANPLKIVKFDLKCPDTPTTYANATTNQTANSYWCACICGVVSGPSIVFNARVDFVDN